MCCHRLICRARVYLKKLKRKENEDKVIKNKNYKNYSPKAIALNAMCVCVYACMHGSNLRATPRGFGACAQHLHKCIFWFVVFIAIDMIVL